MYEYDTMEVNCSELMKSSKVNLNSDTKSSEVLTILVELYEMTYCSAPDGFYSEDEAYFFDKVSTLRFLINVHVRLCFFRFFFPPHT